MKILTALVALVAATVVAVPAHDIQPRALADDSAPRQNDRNFISVVMRAHWYWRRLHCAQDLVWDTRLADAARKDVAQCTYNPKHHRPGSNLSSVKPVPGSYYEWLKFAHTATNGWHEEETKYPYDNPHFEPAWGHFTQMVWRNTTRIGCALGRCSDAVSYPGRFYCYYEYYGNNIAPGQFQAQVWGPVCRNPTAREATERQDVDFNWEGN